MKKIIFSILVIFFLFSCDNKEEKEKTTSGACVYHDALFPGYSYCRDSDNKENCEEASGDGGSISTEFFLDKTCYDIDYKHLCGNWIYKKEKCHED